jgi:IclR family transcriptional regulator, acetate operon repressor
MEQIDVAPEGAMPVSQVGGRTVTSPNGTQAIDRAAMLLTQVVHGAEPASFTELTAACGLAKSTTSRLLMALERHQLVRRDDDGRFWPGALFVRYAWRGTAEADLVAVAQPFLEQLGELTSETINLGIASGGTDAGVTARAYGGGADSDADAMPARARNDAMPARARNDAMPARARNDAMRVEQIAQVDSRYMIGGTNWVGLAVPLHCSALGKVLLAFGAATMPSGPLQARTPQTITTKQALQAEIAAVRDRGYAVTDEELEPGLVAVAAPVFAGTSAAIAAISVSGPASRLTSDQIPATAAQCTAVARVLSATLAGPAAVPKVFS